MTTLDDLFAAGLSRQVEAVPEPDVAVLEAAVLSDARRLRRVRTGVNAALTVAASAVVAAVAWASLHTGAAPANPPTPEPALTGALPAPSLDPVWNGGLYPLEQEVPADFADGFDTSSLPAAGPTGPLYPHALQAADWVWDEAGPGWSLQTWNQTAEASPVLYLVSPGGTFFFVRELDEFTGPEEWSVQSWTAKPARAVLAGLRTHSFETTRRLVDLRTGEDLRVHGYRGDSTSPDDTSPDDTVPDDTVLASGFDGGRSVQLEFERSNGYNIEDDRYEIDGGVTVRVIAPDGSATVVPGVTGIASIPRVTSAGGGGRYAVIYGQADGAVVIVDVVAGRARSVTPELGDNDSCSTFGMADPSTLIASCFHGDQAVTLTFDAGAGTLHEAGEAGRLAAQGFSADGATLVDATTGTAVDVTRAPALASDGYVIPVGNERFALLYGGQLLVYDRASGASYVVVGDTVPGSRAASGVNSVSVLPDRGQGAPVPLELGEYSWF